MSESRNKVICGDALTVLRTLPDCSVHCCVTSPPYYGLRDYGVDGQLGLERTPAEYIAKMVEVFREVRRVLRNDGTLWVNMGDSYNSIAGNYRGLQQGMKKEDAKITLGGGIGKVRKAHDYTVRPHLVDGLKPKDLLGIPWMLAFALREDGWYLRSDIIWHKPNPMPESVTDRPTKSHEYLFLFAKSPKYFYDAQAIAEISVGAEVTEQDNSGYGQDIFCEMEGITSESGFGCGQTISPQCEGKSESRCLPKNRSNEIGEGTLAQIGSRTGLYQEVSQEPETESSSQEILRERSGTQSDSSIPGDGQRTGITPEGSSQATNTNVPHQMRLDSTAVERNQGKTELSLRNLPKEETPDKRPHHTSEQGRSTHCGEHSGTLPKLQCPEGKSRSKNIIGNMSDRGVTRTTEGLNLKTAAEKTGSYRNKRSVWTVATHAFPGAHFATFPPELIRPCIKAGTSEKGCCPACGAPWERTVERNKRYDHVTTDPGKSKDGPYANQTGNGEGTHDIRHGVYSDVETLGWRPTCGCGLTETVPCVVLDPFGGAGTTGFVAAQERRDWILIELSPAYCEMAQRRTDTVMKLPLFNERSPHAT